MQTLRESKDRSKGCKTVQFRILILTVGDKTLLAFKIVSVAVFVTEPVKGKSVADDPTDTL